MQQIVEKNIKICYNFYKGRNKNYDKPKLNSSIVKIIIIFKRCQQY